jgi:hypothetical protein
MVGKLKIVFREVRCGSLDGVLMWNHQEWCAHLFGDGLM